MSKVPEQPLPDAFIPLVKTYFCTRSGLSYWFKFFDESAEYLSNEAAKYRNSALQLDLQFREDADKLKIHPDLIKKHIDVSETTDGKDSNLTSFMSRGNASVAYTDRSYMQSAPSLLPLNERRIDHCTRFHTQTDDMARDNVYVSSGTQTDDVMAIKPGSNLD